MQIKSYFTTCTEHQPYGPQQRLADLGSDRPASETARDSLALGGPVKDGRMPEPLKLDAPDDAQQLDFNSLKQAKQVLKTAGEGLKESGYSTAGREIKQLARGVGVVGHGGRAYEKLSDGKYLDASKESAQALKEGLRLMGKTLPNGVAQGLNGVISAAVIAKYYDYLLALAEDPSAENLDRFLAHSKQVMQNVDDVYELGKFLVGFARTQGPAFTERLGLAITRSEARLAELQTVPAVPVNSQSRLERTSLMVMAGLDVSRALLAGIQAVQEPESAEKMGLVLKRGTTALLSLTALSPETGWVPGALALGTELVPDRAFSYLAENLWDYGPATGSDQPQAPHL